MSTALRRRRLTRALPSRGVMGFCRCFTREDQLVPFIKFGSRHVDASLFQRRHSLTPDPAEGIKVVGEGRREPPDQVELAAVVRHRDVRVDLAPDGPEDVEVTAGPFPDHRRVTRRVSDGQQSWCCTSPWRARRRVDGILKTFWRAATGSRRTMQWPRKGTAYLAQDSGRNVRPRAHLTIVSGSGIVPRRSDLNPIDLQETAPHHRPGAAAGERWPAGYRSVPIR